VKREAEIRLARRFADSATTSLTATYTSPFLPAAGQPQPPAVAPQA
jgi:hypothetical protein